MSLAESLESAAEALVADADSIRPANGDPFQLLELLDSGAAARVLAWLFSHQPEAGVELASAWSEDDAGAALVVSIPEKDLPKGARKALRRLVHQARSRGVEVGEGATAETRVGRLPGLDEKISLAYVSPYDPRGGRLVYIVESNPSGGARVIEALLDLERGIVDFQVYRAGRRQVADFVRDLKGRTRFAAVESDPESVRALISRRLASHPADRPLPKTFIEWRGKLGLAEATHPTPGEQVRSELGGNEAGDLEALVREIEEGNLGPWPPQSTRLEEVAVALQQEFSDRESDSAGLEARVDEEVRGLYLGSETAGVNAERFEETAYLFWKGERSELARACLETADGLRSESAESGPVLTALMAGVGTALTQDLEQRLGWADAAGAPAGAGAGELHE